MVAAVAAESETVRFESEVNADSFHYGYETSDGIYVKAGGELKDVGSEKALVQQGEFSYNDSEGRKITVKYVADEMGFHPEVIVCLIFRGRAVLLISKQFSFQIHHPCFLLNKSNEILHFSSYSHRVNICQ